MGELRTKGPLPFQPPLPSDVVARLSDGCTLAPDRLPGASFRSACAVHDVDYYAGGSPEAKRAADAKLAVNMTKRGAPAIVASAYEWFVGKFGAGGILHDTAVVLGKNPYKWGYQNTPQWVAIAAKHWNSQPVEAYAAATAKTHSGQRVPAWAAGLLPEGTRVTVKYDRVTNVMSFVCQLPAGASTKMDAGIETRIAASLRADRGANGRLYAKGVAFTFELVDAGGRRVASLSLQKASKSRNEV